MILWSSLRSAGGPFMSDPRFVRTTKRRYVPGPNASLREKLLLGALDFHSRLFKPRPESWSFAPNGSARCSIHGLLNQCMDVTGVCFLIERNVASGSVTFRNTNSLNGAQWVRAFKNALQTEEAEWWDPRMKAFRHGPLVLITNDARTVLVVSKELGLRLGIQVSPVK
jgi:hypothetical protein